MIRILFSAILIALMTVAAPASAHEVSLRGSKASVERMYGQAKVHNFSFLRSGERVKRFVELGLLAELAGGTYDVNDDVSYPFVRPEVKLLVERLARQFNGGCGGKLVVTSGTRPTNDQPRNASSKSVHPTGMAVDLRLPNGRCREWLEDNLLALEARGVAEATRERWPPHYHVAVYPRQYACYTTIRAGGACTYVVKSGDTLTAIAGVYGLSVSELKRANGKKGDVIYPGEELNIPRWW